MKKIILFGLLIMLLTACSGQNADASPGMTTRHNAEIPAEYAGLKNPIPADKDSLERGAALYAMNCASCHGDSGMGDGPAGAALDLAPAPVAHTSQTMADDYLFWRISEGGVPFNTSMPPWKVLDEKSRWDLVNYIRAIGAGTAEPASSAGGTSLNPTAQAAH